MTQFSQAHYGPRRSDSDRNAVITVRVKRSWLIGIGIAAATGGIGGVTGFLKSMSAEDTASKAQTTATSAQTDATTAKQVVWQMDQASYNTLVETVNQLSKNDQILEKAINVGIDKNEEQDELLYEISEIKPSVAKSYKRNKKDTPARVDTPPVIIPKRIPTPIAVPPESVPSVSIPPVSAPQVQPPPNVELRDAAPKQEE